MRSEQLPKACLECDKLGCLSIYMDGSADYICKDTRRFIGDPCEYWLEFNKLKEEDYNKRYHKNVRFRKDRF